jgi:predicted phosphodiesterase
MELVFREVTRRYQDPINLYMMGDEHIGHPNHDEKKHKEAIKLITDDPFALVILMGDCVDNREPDHKHFDFEQRSDKYPMKSFIKDCYNDYKSRIEPIKDKILLFHKGNHDFSQKFGFPHVETICEDLGIRFGGYRAFTLLRIQSNSGGPFAIRIFSTHGTGGGRSKKGSKINRIEDEAISSDCDIYCQGHTHVLSESETITQEPIIHNGKMSIKERERYFFNTGCYLMSYKDGNYSYSEKSSYQPQKTGCVMLQIWPKQNKFVPHKIT